MAEWWMFVNVLGIGMCAFMLGLEVADSVTRHRGRVALFLVGTISNTLAVLGSLTL